MDVSVGSIKALSGEEISEKRIQGRKYEKKHLSFYHPGAFRIQASQLLLS
jgi:hypothetical protein